MSQLDSQKPLPALHRLGSVPQADPSLLSSPKASPPPQLPAIKIRIGLPPAGSKRLLSPQSGTRA